VFKFILVHDRYRLETSMRKLADAARRLSRFELMRTSVVQQQERIEPICFRVGKQAANQKPVAHPTPRNVPNDMADDFHSMFLLRTRIEGWTTVWRCSS